MRADNQIALVRRGREAKSRFAVLNELYAFLAKVLSLAVQEKSGTQIRGSEGFFCDTVEKDFRFLLTFNNSFPLMLLILMCFVGPLGGPRQLQYSAGSRRTGRPASGKA